ncbi:hypothetical protein CNMCM5793_004728 [Aspergillus hiratsukae]|uniref:Beta-galactosidase n=1 Tax=Aspergillus hiratsukae TaxID=1194566 RepID=A0A8H6QD32_9EURO|nr:hypothetical protein CNMCM5793_004728 [Aspergillus hiratsukae]KAF7170224.1 hypothetical protein CNMCM6106_005002 [Aspergillus hiratsukae]
MATDISIPQIRQVGSQKQLFVHGKPFLMLAGELHNSSLSSAKYMRQVWADMKANHINTLLGSVTWEMIEPTEGQFDFAELDKVILDARAHNMHMVLLWFGSFKNALSTYVPNWVKKDVKRFPRVHVLEAGGKRRTLELVSPFSDAACQADSRAFSKLMAHLKEIDQQHSTVLMVQVENETGLLGDSRDRSSIANKAFSEPIPSDLLEHLRRIDPHPEFTSRIPSIPSGELIWTAAFGTGTLADELFMANAISKYVGRVAAAGKSVYPVPLYTNAWLNFDNPSSLDLRGLPIVVGGGHAPGIYPSGGPVPHAMDIWRFNAPSLDFLAPDLYFHDYEGVCKNYTQGGNALFIPEQRRDDNGARRVWLAYGTYGALGTSPFGIDTGPDCVSKHYGLLDSIKEILLATPLEERMGFFFDGVDAGGKEKWTRIFGNLEVIVERAFVFGKPGNGAGMVIHLGDQRFLLVGWGFQVRFRGVLPGVTFTGILNAVEKEVGADGRLQTLRVMNGDETRSGEFMIMPNEEPDYGGFPIAVTIPARTMIAEVEAYWVCEEEDDF